MWFKGEEKVAFECIEGVIGKPEFDEAEEEFDDSEGDLPTESGLGE